MCGKDASNNTYIGALLQWYGLATTSKKVTIDSKRVNQYSLCQADLSITRDELSHRAARMIRDGLELIPSHAFVERVIDLSTPFISDIIKRCGHPQTETEQPLQDETIETTNQEKFIDEIDNDLFKHGEAIAQPSKQTILDQAIDLVVNTVTDIVNHSPLISCTDVDEWF